MARTLIEGGGRAFAAVRAGEVSSCRGVSTARRPRSRIAVSDSAFARSGVGVPVDHVDEGLVAEEVHPCRSIGIATPTQSAQVAEDADSTIRGVCCVLVARDPDVGSGL